MMPKPKLPARLLTLFAAAVLVTVDQWIKHWMTGLLEGDARALIPGWIGLRYTRNTGISFSLFGESEAAMRVISAVTALVELYTAGPFSMEHRRRPAP